MSPRKLTDSDKKEILELYRQPEETTSTLASRYGVSSSTISRFLKNNLSEPEYEALIQQKRLSRTPSRPPEQSVELEKDSSESNTTGLIRRRRRRSSAREEQSQHQEALATSAKGEAQLFEADEDEEDAQANAIALKEWLGEDLTLTDLDGDEEEEDLEDTDEVDWEDETEEEMRQLPSKAADVQVLPLSAAFFPKTCYLVIDRAAELITRPLKEFSDLGKIPAEEIQQRTLPVFDNHRVARRFSNRSQRVIKVPDGRMLQKTCPYLEAKGITRLLIDGQVYSLSSS